MDGDSVPGPEDDDLNDAETSARSYADELAVTDERLPRGVKPVLVLRKIREILAAFTTDRPELTLPDIRHATGLPTSTCQRLVANLVVEGFLDRTMDRYRIGLNLAYWAAPALTGLDLVQVLAPTLGELRDETGETACIYRREGKFRVCVAMAETHHAVRREMHVGKIMPLHAGSASRVLLAWDSQAAHEVIGGELNEYTSFTITDPELLKLALAQTRQQGFAITAEERDTGAASVSAPLFGPNGKLVAAIGIAGPTQRLTPQQCREWVPIVCRAAEDATRLLGGRHRAER